MDRRKNWYSIIQYMPSILKGEIINVGALLHDPESGTLKYRILDETNSKLRSLFNNDIAVNVYRLNKDYINHFLSNLPDRGTFFEKSKFDSGFIEDLKLEMPNGFILSDAQFTKTSNPDLLFKKIMENYIGKEYLLLETDTLQVSTKKYLIDYFGEKNLIGTKIKANAKITPIKNIDIHYVIDFVYKNGVLNLMQSTPTNHERLNEWFSKIHTISQSYQKEAGIYLLYNKNISSDYDNTLDDMLSYFRSHDKRIITMDIKSNDFSLLGKKIEDEGKYIDEFEKELA